MRKNCENCYWKNGFNLNNKWCCILESEPTQNVCKNHSFECQECNSNKAICCYNEKFYCQECLFDFFGVYEEQVTHYYLNDDFIGNDNDIAEVLENLSKDIKELE